MNPLMEAMMRRMTPNQRIDEAFNVSPEQQPITYDEAGKPVHYGPAPTWIKQPIAEDIARQRLIEMLLGSAR